MTSLRLLNHCSVYNGGNRHSEIAGGLEVSCWIIFKAQPQIISRLQTYFEERTLALISVLNLEIGGRTLIEAWVLKGMNTVTKKQSILQAEKEDQQKK